MKKRNKKLKKALYLDRETSHGGWPYGKNRGWVDNRPVNDIIFDYLEKMGLTSDVPHARLSEAKIRKIIIESLNRNLK